MQYLQTLAPAVAHLTGKKQLDGQIRVDAKPKIRFTNKIFFNWCDLTKMMYVYIKNQNGANKEAILTFADVMNFSSAHFQACIHIRHVYCTRVAHRRF